MTKRLLALSLALAIVLATAGWSAAASKDRRDPTGDQSGHTSPPAKGRSVDILHFHADASKGAYSWKYATLTLSLRNVVPGSRWKQEIYTTFKSGNRSYALQYGNWGWRGQQTSNCICTVAWHPKADTVVVTVKLPKGAKSIRSVRMDSCQAKYEVNDGTWACNAIDYGPQIARVAVT